jgi:putative acetyltransferase
MDVDIREEAPGDAAAVRHVEAAAFGRDGEADLVDALRADGHVVLSLVAVDGTDLVGHVLLSRAAIVDGDVRHPCLALAPVAVAPDRQRQGIGARLVESALDLARAHTHRIVVVLGHPSYYPRFGFRPAAPHGIRCPYDVPDDTFMVLGLDDDALADVHGLVEYAPAFSAV